MEFKKNIKNRYFLFYLLTVVICFLLGYVLLLSLDKIAHPSIGELYISVYTVFTQLGMLIFPVLVIQTFSTDYKGKNILFYKLMGYNWNRYFLAKVGTIIFWFSLITIAGIVTISSIYGDFSYTLATIFYFECALLYEVLLASMWGFLFKSVIGAYVINFSFWLFAHTKNEAKRMQTVKTIVAAPNAFLYLGTISLIGTSYLFYGRNIDQCQFFMICFHAC